MRGAADLNRRAWSRGHDFLHECGHFLIVPVKSINRIISPLQLRRHLRMRRHRRIKGMRLQLVLRQNELTHRYRLRVSLGIVGVDEQAG